MTKLLAEAVAEIEKLPEDPQDAIAARILADLGRTSVVHPFCCHQRGSMEADDGLG